MLVGSGGHDVGWVAEDQCHINKSQHASCRVLTSLPSVNRWSRGQNSICSSAYPCWQSHIQESAYVSGSTFISPLMVPSSISSSFREVVSIVSAFFAPSHPLDVPGCLPLFPPLVSSSRGKFMSFVLGTPPPDLDTQEIGHSLVVDQVEESIISDSYSDRHSSTADSGTMWSKQTA